MHVLVVLIVFGSIFGAPVLMYAIRKYTEAMEKGLVGPRAGAARKELAELREQKKLLEARVENLESIVCSVDFELNQRLNRLAAEQSRQPLLPTGAPSPAPPPSAVETPRLGHSSTNSGGLRAGAKVADRYTVQRELGRGGMGAVYLAEDSKLGERVALKIVSPLFASDPGDASERFRREVSTARKITHPNVIRIHDLIEDGPNLLLSMEYIDGMALSAYLARQGALSLPEVRYLLTQICAGIEAAHDAGTIHRDLKPGNVLIDAQKKVKLIDFGLARTTFLQGMTATGLILGTPEYMAPEQVRGLACDERTDLYSLGCLAYHMACGRPPFLGDSAIAIGFAHCSEPVRKPRELRPDLPEAVELAILKALAKDPAQRYAKVSDFRAAFASVEPITRPS